MFVWITENLASLLVGTAILALVVLILAGMVRAKRRGRPVGCGCGGDCSCCAGCAHCGVQTPSAAKEPHPRRKS